MEETVTFSKITPVFIKYDIILYHLLKNKGNKLSAL